MRGGIGQQRNQFRHLHKASRPPMRPSPPQKNNFRTDVRPAIRVTFNCGWKKVPSFDRGGCVHERKFGDRSRTEFEGAERSAGAKPNWFSTSCAKNAFL